MWTSWLLTFVLALQASSLGVVGLLGEHCAPCQQVDCSPLPTNCKYGTTLDHCGCCQVCVQSNGERCHFLPNANGVGFICEWGPVTSVSRRITDPMMSRLDPIFRAFLDLRRPFDAFKPVDGPWFDALARHSVSEDAPAKTKVEQFKSYPTCGLYDYLTTTPHEATTEGLPKRQKKTSKKYLGVSNPKGSVVLSPADKLLVSKAEAWRKMREVQRRHDEEVKSRRRTKQKAMIEKKLKYNEGIGSLVEPLKLTHRDLDGTSGDSILSSHTRQRMKADKTGHEYERSGVLSSHDASHHDVKSDVGLLSVDVKGGNSKYATNAQSSMVKTSEAMRKLSETLSELVAMFVERSREMNDLAETKPNETDPVQQLVNLLEKKQAQTKPDRRVTRSVVKSEWKDPALLTDNTFSNFYNDRHRIASRKSVHMKNVDAKESSMYYGDISNNEIDEDNVVQNTREHSDRSNMYTFHKMTSAPLQEHERDDGEIENSLLKQLAHGSEAKDSQWEYRKFTFGNYVDRLLSSGRPLRYLQPRTYYVRRVPKHETLLGFTRTEGGNKDRNKRLSRKKRSPPQPAKVSTWPQRYGSFVIDNEGKVLVESSNVDRQVFEKILSGHFPGQVITSQSRSTKAPINGKKKLG